MDMLSGNINKTEVKYPMPQIKENLFIVRYCIEETYRLGRELAVVSIDFEKAFDTVERVALVRALKCYKCDP